MEKEILATENVLKARSCKPYKPLHHMNCSKEDPTGKSIEQKYPNKMKILYVSSVWLGLSGAQMSNFTYLTTSALVTNAQNHSAIECWRFDAPMLVSTTAGTVGATTYAFPDAYETLCTVIPPLTNGGLHNAPVPQLVIFLSGLIHVTLPYPATGNASLDSAYLLGGANGLLFAADVTGTGHISTYPSDQPTVSLQARFTGDTIPKHVVLHLGPCHYEGSAGQASTYLLGG